MWRCEVSRHAGMPGGKKVACPMGNAYGFRMKGERRKEERRVRQRRKLTDAIDCSRQRKAVLHLSKWRPQVDQASSFGISSIPLPW
jgi:hypothetical protein